MQYHSQSQEKCNFENDVENYFILKVNILADTTASEECPVPEYHKFAFHPNSKRAAAEFPSAAALFHPALYFRWCTGLQVIKGQTDRISFRDKSMRVRGSLIRREKPESLLITFQRKIQHITL